MIRPATMDDLLDARATWQRMALHEQWIRRQALDAILMLAPVALEEARDESHSAEAWALRWHLVTSAGQPAPWAVAAVTLDRDLSTFWSRTPDIWVIPYGDVSVTDPPTFPNAERRRQVGDTLWRAEVEAAMAAIQAADLTVPDRIAGRDSNLKRDLVVWADATIRAGGCCTPGPWPDDCMVHVAEPVRVVKRTAKLLGLAPPRGPGRPPNV